MLAARDSRKMVMARLAMTRGPLAVQTWERSSSKSRSRAEAEAVGQQYLNRHGGAYQVHGS
ncbi:MAG TPA: hypothetical protein VEH31_17345 [Streptosporangiaceae bacterium]|nr:hypothetical protein [Streptosporangiaceae bacterium]